MGPRIKALCFGSNVLVQGTSFVVVLVKFFRLKIVFAGVELFSVISLPGVL